MFQARELEQLFDEMTQNTGRSQNAHLVNQAVIDLDNQPVRPYSTEMRVKDMLEAHNG